MEHARRVSQVWNWLPAFRAVAETQHLPSASQQARVSASALSRAVKQLEEQVDAQLFEREGRHLVLSPAGRRLLGAVRDAMRRVDDGLHALLEPGMAGPFRISAPGPYASIFVLPALERLADAHPELIPQVSSVPNGEHSQRLLDGRLDLVLTDAPHVHDDLQVHLIGQLRWGVYAGDRHPLALASDGRAKSELPLEEALKHAWVSPPPGVVDHWPPHLERKVGLVVTQLHLAVQACATGRWLAALPDAVAEAHRGEGHLVRLPLHLVAPQPLYVVHRRTLVEPGRADVVREVLADELRGASRRSLRGSVQPPEEAA